MLRRAWWSITLIGLVLIAAACAGGGIYGGPAAPTEAPAPAEEAVENQVTMQNIRFQPQEITIEPGATVTWVNKDSFAHTVTAGPRDNPSGLFDSGNVAGGGTFTFTFEEAGTYEYFCSIHGGMDAVVVVGE